MLSCGKSSAETIGKTTRDVIELQSLSFCLPIGISDRPIIVCLHQNLKKQY